MDGALKGVFAAVCALAVAGCGGATLSHHESKISAASFHTYEQVELAYASVSPGITRTPDLARLGFDTAAGANAESLTYIGISDRFLLQSDKPSSHIPPHVLACIRTQNRCAGFVFHLQQLKSRHVGNVLLDAAGFKKNVVDTGWSAEVMLVLQDGVVIYKIMSGQPRIEVTRDVVQPFGVLQNFGNASPEPPGKKNQ